MSEASDFVDAALRYEGTEERRQADRDRYGDELGYYGASVGAVRGAIRDVGRRHPDLGHDDITLLSSELWTVPVFERRLGAAVLLQTHVGLLVHTDLTRIEGFLRDARIAPLVDLLAIEVVGPLRESLDVRNRQRADATLDRWAADPDRWLRRAAILSPLRALRLGDTDGILVDGFLRHVRLAGNDEVVRDAVQTVERERAARADRRPLSTQD